ncbi:hypothetical protein B566_EDAN014239 [Ephemera danica]|nr:hypothetical protein B566_EDAN014239 [Ephemera danica]
MFLFTFFVEQIPLCAIDEDIAQSMGLKAIPSISLLKFINKPGLLYIPNPFTPEGQQRWVLCCLREYTCSPTHKLNLDVHPCWRQESSQWWDLYCKNNEEQCISLRKMLRWSTLGYHHNWDTKVYSEDNRGVFPPDLAQLSQLLVRAAGFSAYQAEAAIVNFYPMDSTLTGHTDHSEKDHTAPLLSLSFGQSAIFLIGGPNKNEQPLALHVQSGDVIIMSGASRLCYHGVPRILPTSQNQSWGADHGNDSDWIHCHRYLCNCRINLNIRQVLPFGNKSLSS